MNNANIPYKRPSARQYNQIRPVEITLSPLINTPTSCMIKYGNTEVICSATVETKVPAFLRGTGSGWITAEYSMLPAATHERSKRDNSQNKPNARSIEIQRLIGRSLRAAVNLKKLGEQQIIIDCDVINADGGTRCASITGGYVALVLAIRNLSSYKHHKSNPLVRQVAAVSCGIFNGNVVVDLDYLEDKVADVDANFILGQDNSIIELQACGEANVFSPMQLMQMLELSKEACDGIFKIQNAVLELAL